MMLLGGRKRVLTFKTVGRSGAWDKLTKERQEGEKTSEFLAKKTQAMGVVMKITPTSGLGRRRSVGGRD